ncbi:MAG: hypothetical protein QHG98_01960 [Methanothrix sp.]|uniref:hypothetical protein n=1 Tax=Methanothrix sp. TaxID=90426 RepID=UPI00247B4DAF|nr:hypothetical protein [Methanothrix sp.]MDH7596498.1 hypothetical protein [Methanothrix sp.]HOK58430.1 hypothetical protein [Methanothrix sp.]HOL43667.1 hypothetical protein [Methanothrix sp.]HPO88658.1 hypothetical protein [Methanothrix sp.]
MSTVLPIARLLEVSKSASSHIIGVGCNLLGELATRAGAAISAISLEILKILIKVASGLDARFQSVLHRPII